MNRKEVTERYAQIVDRAEAYNSKPGNDKRFFPMSDGRRGRLISIGLYDNRTKKYALCDVLSYRVQDEIELMEQMLSK